MVRKHPYLRIYKSWRHVAATIGIILVPLIFLYFFALDSKVGVGVLFSHLGISFGRMIIAYFISAALGWLLATTFARGGMSGWSLPLFDVLQSIPTFALLPIAVLKFGGSTSVVIFFLVFAIVWPIFFSIVSSLHLARRDWEEAVEISGLSKWNYIRLYLLPVTVPGLITGSIVGLGDGWEALVATEIIVGVKSGLGQFFQANSGNTNITLLGVLGFLLLIFVINKLIWLPLLNWSHLEHAE